MRGSGMDISTVFLKDVEVLAVGVIDSVIV